MENRKITYFAFLAVLLLTAVVFSTSVNNDFTNWDDPMYVTDNVTIRNLSINNINNILFSKTELQGSPFTVLIFAVEYKLWGLNPIPYHLTNYVFHLVNVAIVFTLILLMFNRIETATITALFFGIHPMHVESVAWISQLKEVLYAFFYLSALLCYVYYIKKKEGKIKYLIISFFLFFLSVHSKISAASLPFVLFLFDYYYQRKFSWKIVFEKLFFFIPIAYPFVKHFIKRVLLHLPPSLPAPVEMPQFIPDYSFVDRIFLAGYSLGFYILKFFAPVHLNALHPYPGKINGMLPSEYYAATVATIILLTTITIILWKIRYAKRELIFGTLFFFVTISMFLHIIPIKGIIVTGERYTYIPYIGLFIIAGHFYALVADRKTTCKKWIKPLFFTILAGYTVFFSIASWNRNKVWKNGLTLFTDVIQKNPKVTQAYINRGNMKQKSKDYEGALEDYNKAIELSPGFAFSYNNRGILNMSLKNYAQAEADFNKAIEVFPRYVEGYRSRANFKKELSDFKGAMDDLNKAIEIKPDYASAYNDRGTLRYVFHDYTGAVEDFSKAVKLNPIHWEAYNNRGNTKNILQDYNSALSDFNKCIELNPVFSDAYNNRGFAENNLKDFKKALLDFEKAIQLRPDFAEAYNNNGMALVNLREYNLALSDFNYAIKLNPDYTEAYNNRAIAYFNLKDYKTALQDLNKAVSINPYYAEGYSNRGILKTYSGDYEGAVADYSKLLELDPQNVFAHINRGNANLKINRIKEACEDWRSASKLGYTQAEEMLRKYCN